MRRIYIPAVENGEFELEESEAWWVAAGRRVFVWLLITVVLWFAVAGYLLFDAQRHARAGEEALRSVADVIESDDLAEVDFAAVERTVDDGEEQLAGARSSIDSVVVRALRPVPVVGRQVASARALIHSAHDVTLTLQPLVASARSAQEDPNDLDRVAFLATVSDQLGAVEQAALGADLGPAENLVGPLIDGRVELAEELADLANTAAEYRVVTDGVGSFLDDSDYLVLGANNAEMMLATGMHLSVGSLRVAGGDFELPGLTPSADLFPVLGAPLVDADVGDRWGFLNPTNDFRKLGYSPRFDDFTGPQGLEMWRASRGEELDGVIALDPFVLDALLGVIGGVEVEGQRFDPGQALAYLLQDQYVEFDPSATDERRDRLSVLAAAVVEQFGVTAWDPVELLSALRPLAGGRHILLYSTDPVEQAAWEQLGVSGTLAGDEIGVFVQNIGASKLDPFVEVDVRASSVDDEDERVVRYEVSVRNRAPSSDLPVYMAGPWMALELPRAGTYFGRLAVYVPGSTLAAGFIDSTKLVAFGSDGPVVMAGSKPFEVVPGGEVILGFEYRLPVSQTELTLIPSARFPAVTWTWGSESFDDAVKRTVVIE